MTLHLGLSSHSQARNAQQQQEIKDARRILKERVRTDWNYPPLPAYRESGRGRSAHSDDSVAAVEDKIAGFRFRPSPTQQSGTASSGAAGEEEPVAWREREYSSASSAEEDDTSAKSRRKSQNESWKFEGPDSVGTELLDRQIARKRKREKSLSDEKAWNEGLAHWLERRDAWCGAKTTAQIRARDAAIIPSARSTPRTSTSASTATSVGSTIDSAPAASSPSTSPDLELPSTLKTAAESNTSPLVDSDAETTILIPVAPAILINHPVRRKITPSIYPEIYSKIIVQSRTPSVPINLKVLINALVQGWKDDGEWPPKPGPVERSIGRKKGKDGEGALRHGVRAVTRVLRITSGDSGVVANKS